MKSKKHCLLLTILILVSISLVMTNDSDFDNVDLLGQIEQHEPSADGDAWLTGWQYREKMTFATATGAGTYYPFEITVYHDTDDGTDGVDKVCTEGNAKTDFSDIRFTDSDGEFELDYYRLEYTASTSATFWFELKDDVSSGTVVAYVYYGNAGASYDGDGDDVFYFFDDFEDDDLDEWTNSGGAIESTIVHTGSKSVKFASGTNVRADFAPVTRGILVHFQGYSDNSFRGITAIAFSEADADALYIVNQRQASTSPIYYYYDTGAGYEIWSGCADIYNDDTWYEYEVGFDQNYATPDPDMRLFMEGGYIGEEDHHQIGNTDFDTENIAAARVGTFTTYVGYMDDFWVRKWQVIEPYIISWAAEEDTKPVNDAAAVCTNPSDGDNLYPQYTTYTFTSSHQDVEGYDTIEYVELSLSLSEVAYWTVRYTEATDTYSETVGSDYIELLEGSESKSGINLDITWNIKIEWAHGEKWNHEPMVKVVDEAGFYSQDETVGEDYEVICELVITTPDDWITADDTGDADYGDISEYFTVSANAHYYTGVTTSAFHPPNGAVTWWLRCIPISFAEASHTTGAEGAFSVTGQADTTAVGADTFELKAVPYNDPVTSTSLFTTEETDVYTADRVVVTGYAGIGSNRVDIGDYGVIAVHLEFELSSTLVESGTVHVNGLSASWLAGPEHWSFGEIKYTTQDFTYDTVTYSGTELDGAVNQDSKTYLQIWDRIDLTMTSNYDWTIIDHNVTLSATGVFEYDSASWSGVITWSDRYPSESVVNSYNYGASQITSVTDPTYGLTVFFVGTETSVVFDDVVITGGDPNYYWVQYSPDAVWLIWGSPCSFEWDYNNSAVMDGIVIQSKMNGTENARASTDGGSIYGLSIGSFDTDWYYVNIAIHSEFTVDTRSFDLTTWTTVLEVDILHSLQIVNFNIIPTDEYFWIVYQTNRLNASITIWDDAIDSGTLFADNIYHSDIEGMHYIDRSTIIGIHNLTFCITSTGVHYDKDYTVHDYVWWYDMPYEVTVTEIDVDTITLFGAGEDFTYMEWSFELNLDCTYVIREWSENVAAEDTHSGSVGAGTPNIAWPKLDTADQYVNFTVTFTNGSLIYVFTSSYQVAQTALAINDRDWGFSEEEVTFSGEANKDGTYTIYLDNVQLSTDSFSSGSIFLNWTRSSSTDPSAIDAAIKFTDGTTTIWVNRTYDEYSLTSLSITVLILDMSGPNVTTFIQTSLENATITVYQDDVQKATGEEGTSISYPRSTTGGTYNVAIKIFAGVSAGTIWHNDSYTVDEIAALALTSAGFTAEDDWLTFWVFTNRGTSTFTIWDNSTLVGYSSREGMYQIAKPTIIGLHNYTVLVNSTHSGSSYDGQVRDYSTSDDWLWLIHPYTINPVQLSVDVKTILQNNATCIVAFQVYTPTLSLTWSVSELSAGVVGSGSFTIPTSGSYTSVWWAKSAIDSSDSWNLTITAGSNSVIIPGVNIIVDSAEYTTVNGGYTDASTTNTTNINQTVYQAPEGVYISQELAATIAIGAPIAIFLAVILVREWGKRLVLKMEEMMQK